VLNVLRCVQAFKFTSLIVSGYS